MFKTWLQEHTENQTQRKGFMNRRIEITLLGSLLMMLLYFVISIQLNGASLCYICAVYKINLSRVCHSVMY